MAAAGLCCITLAPVAAQGAGSAATFRFSPEAGGALRALWEESSSAQQERVACLGADVRGDTVFVTQILRLEPVEADSIGVSALTSIDQCGPPDWKGTVHTHVALYTDDSPSRRFSGQDRVIMRMWYDRWRADGVFCVAYSPRSAHCEADGIVGGIRSRPRVVP
jgi:hypothetical protein